MYGNLIDQLIDALRCLPGVGAKSAQAYGTTAT